ncbi:MAG: hypothetical protein OXF68_08695 [Gammaproteobacteria bacterium]|nr:hypothetical protein [Gammaproteobacteria bacterium]MCY4343563.1 hypothetical protein [Gammaproteobacteria bacterium]
MTDPTGLRARLKPVLEDMVKRSAVAGRFVHRDTYRIMLATLWANLVLKPEDAGIGEADLEAAHDILSTEAQAVLGDGEDLTACFAFLNSKPGEAAMQEARLSKTHKDLLLYFCSMILDPDGHRKWMERMRESATQGL